MSSTQDYLRKPLLAAAFALAAPLYAYADLLPPPFEVERTEGDFTHVATSSMALQGASNMAQAAADNPGKTGGPASKGNAFGGGQGSAQGRAGTLPAARGGSVDNDTPPSIGLPANNTFTGAGQGLGLDVVGNTPNPASAAGSNGARDVPARNPVQAPRNDYLTNPRNYVVDITGYCVDKVTGNASTPGIVADDSDCSSAELFVSGDLEQINDPIPLDSIQSLDLGLANNIDGGEKIGIADQFGPSIQIAAVAVPATGTLLLLGAGLFTLGAMRRRTA